MIVLLLTVLALVLAVPKLLVIWTNQERDMWIDAVPHWLARLFYGGVMDFAEFWHDYEVHGLEHVSGRNCLLVGYHSRCTVDGVYATAAVRPTTIMSPIFFAVPGSTAFFDKIHCVSTHRDEKSADSSFVDTVCNGHRPVMLFPGGHHECFKPLVDKHIVRWKEVPGYARALLAEPDRPGQLTKVVPFYTNNCEDIYPTTDWWYDYSGKMVLQNFRDFENGKTILLPLLLPKSLFALGFLPLPRPVKLDLYFGPPVLPLEGESDASFAARVRDATQQLVEDVRQRHREQDKKSKSIGYMVSTYPLYTLFTFVQNTIMWGSILVLNVIFVPLVMIVQYMLKMLLRRRRHRHTD